MAKNGFNKKRALFSKKIISKKKVKQLSFEASRCIDQKFGHLETTREAYWNFLFGKLWIKSAGKITRSKNM